jgi:hypothetical protein
LKTTFMPLRRPSALTTSWSLWLWENTRPTDPQVLKVSEDRIVRQSAFSSAATCPGLPNVSLAIV